eukprot:jgi/Hompol1/2473/HPOL_000092-RA
MDLFVQKLRSWSSSSETETGGASQSQSSSPAPLTKQPNFMTKRPRDSYVELFLRFKSDPAELDDYINAWNEVRVGKVLEDLDALAAAIAFLHVGITKRSDAIDAGVTVVTASVDRIDMLRSIPSDRDVKLSGFVTYVGASSLEISLSMETCPDNAPPPGSERFGYEASFATNHPESEKILTAKFIMATTCNLATLQVALDPKTNKATKVNQLILETDEDRQLFLLGADNKQSKKEASQTALTKVPPRVDEMLLIHDLYLEHKQYLDPTSSINKPESAIWMKDAVQESLTVCMPQERNLHNKIFGGYLMRLAFELAYANALTFAESPIVFVALDDITFRSPVNIGSLLSLRSQVVYAPGPPSSSFQVAVKADVINPLASGVKRQTTNTFHFTFAAPNRETVPRVLPKTYEESMAYIDGRRRKQRWIDEQEKRSSGKHQ